MSWQPALVIALLIVTAGIGGCLGGAPADTPDTTVATGTPTTDGPDESTAGRPARPAELTVESAVEYAETYEQAYRTEWVYRRYDTDTEDVTRVQFSVSDVHVKERHGDGFVATLQYALGVTTVTESGRERAKDLKFTAGYFVNDSTTRRAVRTGYVGDGLDPVENGTAVPTSAD